MAMKSPPLLVHPEGESTQLVKSPVTSAIESSLEVDTFAGKVFLHSSIGYTTPNKQSRKMKKSGLKTFQKNLIITGWVDSLFLGIFRGALILFISELFFFWFFRSLFTGFFEPCKRH
jgi:hypothetical protein